MTFIDLPVRNVKVEAGTLIPSERPPTGGYRFATRVVASYVQPSGPPPFGFAGDNIRYKSAEGADYVSEGDLADEVVIQKAVDEVAALGGGTVVLSEGDFYLAGPVLLPEFVSIRGQGFGTMLFDQQPFIVEPFSLIRAAGNQEITRMKFFSFGFNANQVSLIDAPDGAENLSVTRCYFFGDNHVTGVRANGGRNIRVIQNTFSFPETGAQLSGVDDFMITNNTFELCEYAGFRILDCDNGVISGNFWDAGNYRSDYENNEGSFALESVIEIQRSRSVSVTNNVMDFCGGGVKVSGTPDTPSEFITISGNTFTAGFSPQFFLDQHTRFCTISGNCVHDGVSEGNVVLRGPSCEHNLVTNNIFHWSGPRSDQTSVRITGGANRNTVSMNQVTTEVPRFEFDPNIASVIIEVGCEANVVVGNDLREFGTARALSDGGSQTLKFYPSGPVHGDNFV